MTLDLKFPKEGVAVVDFAKENLEEVRDINFIAGYIEANKPVLDGRKRIILDFETLERFTSIILEGIVMAGAACKQLGYDIRCIRLNDYCKERYTSLKLHEIVPVYDTLDDALD